MQAVRERLTRPLRVALAVIAAGATLQAQQLPPLTGTGLILGRVVDASTGQPVSTVTVLLSTTTRGIPQETALTGPDGQFAFMELPTGSYNLSAIKSGYLDGAYGRARPGGAGASLKLQPGQRLGDLKILMWRPSVISGHIDDDAGRPLAGVTVTATRGLAAGPAVDSYGGSGVTNEHGDYRIPRMIPGEYSLSVVCRVMSVPIPASAGAATPNVASGALTVDDTGHYFSTTIGPRAPTPTAGANAMMYLTSYFPGTTRVTEATTVAVAPGEERTGADFAIAVRQSVRVSGVVTGPNGPIAMAMVRLWQPDVAQPAGENPVGSFPIASAITAGDGSFLFLAAPTGDYLLDGYRPQPPIGEVRMSPEGIPQLQTHDYSSSDPEGWTAAMPISIAGDTRDIALTMAPRSRTGASVSGSVVFDQMMTFNNGRPLDPFFISLESNTGGGMSGPVRADAPGPFAITVTPGRYELRAGALLQGFEIVAATLGGRDILGTPLDVGPDGMAGLVIRIGNRLNTITGKVTDTQGRVVRDAGIALFPTDTRGWPLVARTSPRVVYRRAEADTYAISGFPDGEYFIAAVDDALMANWPSAALLTPLSAHAVRIDVRGGMAKTQNLVVVRTIK